MDEEYDNINIEIKNINKELEEYLSEQRRFFGCQVCLLIVFRILQRNVC